MAPPYRADHVGSLLRPPELLQARDEFSENRITADAAARGRGRGGPQGARPAARGRASTSSPRASTAARAGAPVVATRSRGWCPTEARRSAAFFGHWQGPHGELANADLTRRRHAAWSPARSCARSGALAGAEAAFLKQHAPGPWKITMPGADVGAGQLFKPGVTDARLSDAARPGPRHRRHAAQRDRCAASTTACAYIQLDSLHYVERVADTTIRGAHDRRGR